MGPGLCLQECPEGFKEVDHNHTECVKPAAKSRNPIFKWWWEGVPSGRVPCGAFSEYTCEGTCEQMHGEEFKHEWYWTQCTTACSAFANTTTWNTCLKWIYTRGMTDMIIGDELNIKEKRKHETSR